MLSTESIIMAIFGFVVLYGGLFYFLRIAMKKRQI
ncbi:MAG: MetS family NSS transporter small subunit [Methanohalobium sp.]